MKKIDKLVSEDEIQDAEVNRNIRGNGGSSSGKWDDFLSDSDEDDDFSSNLDDILGNSSGSSGGVDDLLNSGSGSSVWDADYTNNNQYSPYNTVEEKSAEDKFFDFLKNCGKGFMAFLKEFVETAKKTESHQVTTWGRVSIVVSAIISVIALILTILSVNIGLPMFIGALISLASSLCIFGIAFDREKKHGNKNYMDKIQNLDIDDSDEIDLDDEDSDEDEDDFSELINTTNTDEDSFGDLSDSDDEVSSKKETIDWNALGLDDEDTDNEGENEMSNFNQDSKMSRSYDEHAWEEEEEMNTASSPLASTEARDDYIERIDIDRNTVTRSYLVETYSKILPTINSKYAQKKDYDEDTTEFKAYNALVQKAAKLVVGKKGIDELPCLLELSDRALYTKMVISRVELDIKKFVVELTQLMSYDKETDQVDEDLYITSRVVGDEWILKVFTGSSVMVSILDTYNDKKVKEFIMNSKNMMPVVLGVNEEGEAVILDVEKVNSLLITGMPRSGKSWFALALLTQLTMYMKPSQLEIYMIDPKGDTSDFRDFMPPHVKCFVSKHEDIINLLTRLIDVEAARRTKMFGEQNVKNIQDWNKKNPLEPCPYIYVYIDEVVTLAEAMDKETKTIFQSKLMEITTRLPNLGIRPILVPHVVKNQFLNKSITDNIPCRISVKGDEKHIAACVGEDTPPFTYKLTHVGDMAVMLLDRHIHFVHSVVVTTNTDDNIEIFEFIRKLWEKMEPDSIPSSCYYKKEHGIDVTTIGDAPSKKQIKLKKGEQGTESKSVKKKVEVKKKVIEEKKEEMDFMDTSEFAGEDDDLDEDGEVEDLEDSNSYADDFMSELFGDDE